MEECGRLKSHWPHTITIDGLPSVCIGHGIGRRVFWSWPPRFVLAISELRKAWRRGGV